MKKLSDYVQQNDNYLVTMKDCSLILDIKDDYDIGDNMSIDEENETIWVSSLVSKIIFDDIQFDLILDYPVNIFIENMTKVKKEYIKLTYSAESNILETVFQTENIKEQVAYLERLISGKIIFLDVDHLFLKLYTLFQGSGMDLVHLETLISNILRDAKNNSIPARLGDPFDPIMMNIKSIVFNKNTFLSSLAFENVNKSIIVGLVSGEEAQEKSILEKVLLNDIVD